MQWPLALTRNALLEGGVRVCHLGNLSDEAFAHATKLYRDAAWVRKCRTLGQALQLAHVGFLDLAAGGKVVGELLVEHARMAHARLQQLKALAWLAPLPVSQAAKFYAP